MKNEKMSTFAQIARGTSQLQVQQASPVLTDPRLAAARRQELGLAGRAGDSALARVEAVDRVQGEGVHNISPLLAGGVDAPAATAGRASQRG